MSVKIINIFKEDTFNDILELFRKATASEVILVLPRVGKIFRTEDHFAALAAEAKQAGKSVSVLSANPESAIMARKFGFAVMASGSGRPSKPLGKPAKLITSPPPADFSTPSFDDNSDMGDVPLTADQTAGIPSEDAEDRDDEDPLRGMHVEDEKGEPEQEKVQPVADDAAFSVAVSDIPPDATLATAPLQEPLPNETDYIDSVWRTRNPHAPLPTAQPIQRTPIRSSVGTAARTATGSKMSKRITVGILTASIFVLFGVIYLMTGSAHVALTPVGKSVDMEITVQASDTYTSVDDAFAKIPGQLIEISKTAEKTEAATGSRDVASKARGTITVYNEYSSTPQTLVATTRFQSASGKVFRTLRSVTIPGSTVNAGSTLPGKVNIDVVADAPGPDYNVAAGDFVIMAFKEKGDTEKATKFYGKSSDSMSGGASGPSKVVLQSDFDKAKEAATEDVRNQITTAIQSQGADLTVLDAETAALGDVTATAKPDDSAESVTVTAAANIKTIAFRTEDLKTLVVANALNKERLVVLPDELEFEYSDVSFKPDLGTLVFTVSVKGTGYMPVDTDVIAKDITGKNSQSIQDYFKDREGVLSATVTLSPFWVRSVPKQTEDITVELIHETPPADDEQN